MNMRGINQENILSPHDKADSCLMNLCQSDSPQIAGNAFENLIARNPDYGNESADVSGLRLLAC